MRNAIHERLSFMAGCLAFIIPLVVLRVDFPALSTVLKAVLAAHLVSAMGVCGVVGGYRWRLGMVVLLLALVGAGVRAGAGDKVTLPKSVPAAGKKLDKTKFTGRV